MKLRQLKTALLLALLSFFALQTQAQLMLNVETTSGSQQLKVEDIARIDFDENSSWSLNFSSPDDIETTYSIPLSQRPVILINEQIATIQWHTPDFHEINMPAQSLLSGISFLYATSSVENNSLSNESMVRMSVEGNSLCLDMGKVSNVDVYTVDGRSVYSNPTAIGKLRINLHRGISIVKINHQTFKIIM